MIRLLLQALECLWKWLVSLFRRNTGPVITLDTGRQVRLSRKIAEGGFSYVFEAVDVHKSELKYALKRIRVGQDAELLGAVRKEAAVHRSVQHHPNVMPLLGLAIHESLCYMLFPHIPHSLRTEVNERVGWGSTTRNDTARPPWNPLTALKLFLGVVDAVQALHEASYSHRDIKLENVLLKKERAKLTPVLMDFGSAGPLHEEITTRRHVMRIVEEAASHTTLPYRPPELFEGGVRPAPETLLDYTKVDVWSLGCTLFAILYGASPFESEFRRPSANRHPANTQHPVLQIVDCTHLKVLGAIPKPTGPPVSQWYPESLTQLVEQVLVQDVAKRPTLAQLTAKVEGVITELGGHVESRSRRTQQCLSDDDDDGPPDDFGALLKSRNFV